MAKKEKHDCKDCDQSFDSERRLERHMSKAHGKTPTDPKVKYGAAVVLLALALVGALTLTGGSSADDRPAPREKYAVQDDPHLGNESAPVVVVGFETPRCSGCRFFHERIQPGLEERYFDTGKAVLYYSQYTIGYDFDEPGGIAQECVHREGGSEAFWAFTDVLYRNQGQYNAGNVDELLRAFAEDRGMDADRLVTCYEGRETQSLYDDDVATGNNVGISGTPTFFVFGPEGKAVRAGAGELEQVIQDKLAEAGV